jgi:hypothetical protein
VAARWSMNWSAWSSLLLAIHHHHRPQKRFFSPPKVRDSRPGIAAFNGTANALTIVHIDHSHGHLDPGAAENPFHGQGSAGLCPADRGEPTGLPAEGPDQFWADQAAIFARTHGGKLIKNGSKFVGDMTGPHIAQRKVERTESGTVQPDTELGQALDRWVQFEDGQKAESLAAVEERRRDGEVVRGRRGQMLLPKHLRRVASAAALDTPSSSGPVSSAPGPHPLRRAASDTDFGGTDDGGEDDDLQVLGAPAVALPRRAKRARRGEPDSTVVQQMAEVVGKLTEKLVQPADQGGSGGAGGGATPAGGGSAPAGGGSRRHQDDVGQSNQCKPLGGVP